MFDIPGLLTPEMQQSLRAQALMSAGAALMQSGAPSPGPKSFGGILAPAIQAGMKSYSDGTTDIAKLLLVREQMRKYQSERDQEQRWNALFGGGGAGGDPSGMPAGLLTQPNAAPRAAPEQPAPGPAPDAAPTGLLTPPGYSPPAATAAVPAARSAGPGSMREAIATMPAPIRQIIGAMPAKEGMGAALTWLGRKPDKPSETFISVRGVDGVIRPYRADDPAIDGVIRAGGVVVTTPSSAEATGSNTLVTLLMPDGKRKTFRAGSKEVDEALGKGAEHVTTLSSNDKPSTTFVSVRNADGIIRPYRADSPELDTAIAAGGQVVTTPAAEKKPSTTFVSVRGADGKVQSYRADSAALDGAIEQGGQVVTTPSSNPGDRKPDNYSIPGTGETVLSYDGGKTYEGADGTTQKMPRTALRLGADTAVDAARTVNVQSRAQRELENVNPQKRPPAEGPTLVGTGGVSAMQEAFNKLAGGIGADTWVGMKGFFPENAANRDYLNGIKQQAKTALVNNPRFPVAEQKNIDRLFPNPDEFWTNPRTEVNKIPILRNMLQTQLKLNNEAIASGGLAKEETSKLTSNNLETRRALSLLGDGPSDLGALKSQDQVPKKTAADAPGVGVKKPTEWTKVPVGTIVHQGGKMYKKMPDGSAVEY
jgi:hypothetical protein